MILKLGMGYYELKLYTFHINDDPDLFYSNVKFGETCFCTYGRPRYQVSIYRIIGPLVFVFHSPRG